MDKKIEALQKLISGHQNIVFFGAMAVIMSGFMVFQQKVEFRISEVWMAYIIRNGIIRRRRF